MLRLDDMKLSNLVLWSLLLEVYFSTLHYQEFINWCIAVGVCEHFTCSTTMLFVNSSYATREFTYNLL